MKTRISFFLGVFLMLAIMFPTSARADGIIIPEPPVCVPGPCPPPPCTGIRPCRIPLAANDVLIRLARLLGIQDLRLYGLPIYP